MSESKVTLKLQVDKKNNKVLYAEAGKGFVDFLFHVFLLPVGAAMRHLVNDETSSVNTFGLGNLYNSLRRDDFTSNYLSDPKYSPASSFFNPRVNSPAASKHVRLWSGNDLPPEPKRESMRDIFAEEGYVKGLVKYMITDDLVVKALSSKSTIELLGAVSVKDLGSIEESVVTLDAQQGMALLKASLTSKTVFTDIFLRGKAEQFSVVE